MQVDVRSAVLTAFFDWLNVLGANYCVMNNYDNLPTIIPSDVDIAIDIKHFSIMDSLINQFSEQAGVRVAQKLWHGNYKCAYILIVGDFDEKKFLQLDFFVDFSIRGCPMLIDYKNLVMGCQPFRNFYIPRPDVEIVFIIMRRLFKNDWSFRHCDQITKLYNQIKSTEWLPHRYSWMLVLIELAIKKEIKVLAQRRNSDWNRLKRTAIMGLSIKAHLENLYWQSRRILNRLRYETGNLTVVSNIPHANESFGLSITEALSQVFYRSFVISSGSFVKIDKRLSLVTWPLLIIHLKLFKVRKGLIVIEREPLSPQLQRFLDLLQKLRIVDLSVDGFCSAQLSNLEISGNGMSEKSAVINAILDVQVAKTRIVMSLPGSQTSGVLYV